MALCMLLGYTIPSPVKSVGTAFFRQEVKYVMLIDTTRLSRFNVPPNTL